MAIESLGDAWVDVHARTEPFDGELSDGLNKELKEADDVADKGGKEIGKTLTDSIEKEAGKHGKEIGKTVTKSVEEAIEKETLDFKPDLRYNRRGKNGRFVKRVVDDIERDVASAFASSAGGGFFNFIQRGIADAVGAGFNISGQSPLIGLLIPAVGALIGLVVGAVQAVNSLVAVIASIPALIGAIGLQVGVLLLAFKGVGTAIQGAFAATNAKELKEALQGLTPPAQQFVKSLLPLKGLIETLQKEAQTGFFKQLTDVIPKIQASLQGPLQVAFTQISSALGGLFREVGLFFASPSMKQFVQDLIPSVVNFLETFGPNFVDFIRGLIEFANTTIPFLDKIGELLGGQLGHFGEWLSRMANDPATKKWLDDMYTTFVSVVTLVEELITFVGVLLAQLNAAGGQEVLDEIVKDVTMITDLLGSDFGQKAMEGLVHIVILALQVTTGLILAFVLLLGLFEITAEFIKHALIPAIADAAVWIWNLIVTVGKAIADFFVTIATWVWNLIVTVGSAIGGFFVGLWNFFADLRDKIKAFFERVWESLNNGRGKLLLLVTELPGKVKDALGNLGSLLLNAGKNLVQGLINGIRSMFSSLWNTGKDMIGFITAWLPGSPAEVGPLSGKGYVKLRGQRMVQDFAAGIQAEMPTLNSTSSDMVNNIVFGSNSIRVGFEGVVPTTQQAQTTGTGVANGIMGGLMARNVRLAVRTI